MYTTTVVVMYYTTLHMYSKYTLTVLVSID